MMQNFVPARRLPAGATLGLFSPSEPLTPEREAVLRSSIKIAERHGFRLVFASNALSQGAYSAGTVAERLEDIAELAENPDVDALFATWGGKSCNQLVTQLDYDLLRRSRKPIVGFSDVAVLQNAVTWTTGLATFHFLVAGRLPETDHAAMDLLKGGRRTTPDLFDFRSQQVQAVFREGVSEGRLFGGNLSTFVLGLVGTPYLPMGDNIVFFWESASERAQVVDQHLTTLRNTGFFERVSAMIIGSVYSGKELSIEAIRQAIAHSVGDYSFPILYAPSFGHLPTQNPVIPIGARCRVDTSSFSVELVEPDVVTE